MQGAGHSWQQEVSPLAPLGVSATQESDSSVPQSENEYKGLDELLGKAKRDRDGEKKGGLTWDEESAIVGYKSGDSGKFLPDDPINLGGYLSVSMDPNTDRTGGQYTVDMVIDAKTARSINGFGANTEREAILPRGVDLVPRSMERVGPYNSRSQRRSIQMEVENWLPIVCGTCEKANRGARTCAVYPDGIPWEYRRKVKGRPDERDTTPDCPEYQQTTNPQRWMTPEWRQIMQDLEREVERDRERGK